MNPIRIARSNSRLGPPVIRIADLPRSTLRKRMSDWPAGTAPCPAGAAVSMLVNVPPRQQQNETMTSVITSTHALPRP